MKPDPKGCGKRYCFFWVEVGDRLTDGTTFRSLEEAHATLGPPEEQARCPLPWGGMPACSRSGEGEHDMYERCEPALQKAGLPLNYFRG